MDWVLKKPKEMLASKNWVEGSELRDLDFADDIVFLRVSWANMQDMTLSLEKEGKKLLLTCI
jgi:hypothetical protein